MVKKYLTIFSCLLVLAFGIWAMCYAYFEVPITYDGSDTDVTKLYSDPSSYDLSDPDGVADIIVKTDLEQTRSANVVAAVVFDYRGFDTIGESFILLAAISGSFVILRNQVKKRKEDEKDEV